MASLLSVVCTAWCIQYTLAQSCSSIDSYVQVTSPDFLEQTLLSAKALFSPFSYYVESTEVVIIDTQDDICSESTSFSTDVTDKIALILPWDTHNCSDVLKVYVAQLNGAKAVLLTNSDKKAVGTVTNILDDDTLDIEPSIPSRMIAYNAAKALYASMKCKALLFIHLIYLHIYFVFVQGY